PEVELVAANGPAPLETHLHLLKYDSVHGRFPGELRIEGDSIVAGRHRLRITHEKDPRKIDWKSAGVDMVMECTGKFNNRGDAEAHLAGGAGRVIISAPARDAEATIVYGVNNAMLKKAQRVISVGSCTTNCLAPLAQVLHQAVGIESGFMTTIHSYTGDQNLVDGSHKDLRRARAAGLSMIPTSTGAAKTIGLVLPELAGKLDGIAIRVPTPNVSLVDLTFHATRDTDSAAINAALSKAAGGALRGVLGVSGEKLVSVDFAHNPLSGIVDLAATHVVGTRLVRVASWYDNEWGFSNRMWDVARLWGRS
ncbi:MAG: type I glyceraldehyde-3-phosphate dehydrogenase, partial [Alphaproteobacteria bacterium]|nr:type I glyceraldehyde-3-phosphate dehydrogenase [Alphaproteobacteria bacterium]